MLLSDVREIVADGNDNLNSYYAIELFTERQNFIILRVNQIRIERDDYYLQIIKCFDKFGNLITELLAEDIHDIAIKTMKIRR